jgi:hypothetical protein
MANTMTYDDWETLKERRATAKALRQQALGETVEGKMVSGRFVAPSWTQHLAQALRTYKAGKEEKAADQAMKDARKSMLDTYRNAFGVAQGETPSVDPGFGKPMPSGSVDPGFGMPMPGADMTRGPLGGQPASPGMPAPMPQPPAMQALPESGEPMTSPLGQPMQEPMGQPMGQAMPNRQDIVRALLANPLTAEQGFQMYMQGLNDENALALRQADLQKLLALEEARAGYKAQQNDLGFERQQELERLKASLRPAAGGTGVAGVTGQPGIKGAPFQIDDGQGGTELAVMDEAGNVRPLNVRPPASAAAAKNQQLARNKLATMNTLEESLSRLEALSNELTALQSGPLGGKTPALSDAAARYESTLGLVRPMINALTRVPGEGSVSDFEQRLKELQLPGRAATKAGRDEALLNLRLLIREIRSVYEDADQSATPEAMGAGFPESEEEELARLRALEAAGGTVP